VGLELPQNEYRPAPETIKGRRTIIMVSEQLEQELKAPNVFYKPSLELNNFKRSAFDFGLEPSCPEFNSPAQWFSYKYQEATKQHGCPFLEHRIRLVDGYDSLSALDVNLDFFASILKGNSRLGHSVIYYEPELQWYFKDSDQIYKTTSPEKLQNWVRAMFLKCAEVMPRTVDPFNLYTKFRSDQVVKAIVNRAKSILAANESFFSASSPHKREQGPELPERLARVFIESMLEKREGTILTVTQAYALFSGLSLQNNLQPIKRATFKQMMTEKMKETFGMSIRRDLVDEHGKQQEGWKNVGPNVRAGEVKAA
jgi:hypothetical protein